jgi:primosomal protein N' (replication factor Y)
MLYAKVVLGIPVEGPFDYNVPAILAKKIKVGMRVQVSFRNKKAIGYVVKLTKKTKIKNLKSILGVIDETAILSQDLLSLTKELSNYYCCSWGQAIETALPRELREGKIIKSLNEPKQTSAQYDPKVILIHDPGGELRWDIYLAQISEALNDNKSAIILLPDVPSVLKAKDRIISSLHIMPALLYRDEPGELKEWLKAKGGENNIVVGSRSSIFAPFSNLGLVIIDEEQNSVYKQDQVPHYHARDIAFMRINRERAKLILGSTQPSLESYYLAKNSRIEYKYVVNKTGFPDIKIIDTRLMRTVSAQRKIILSKYLEDTIASVLNTKGKILLFLNRKGFATFSYCSYCGIALKCPRCNISLVYHFKDNILNCHYCNFKMALPTICPNCNSGYIKYSGIGTEKIESELCRLFPQARIKRLERQVVLDLNDADIFISTESIIKQTNYRFDLIGVLGIDNSLNLINFRSTEHTISLLVSLLRLARQKIIIQTNIPNHYCFQALLNNDINIFFNEELKHRKELYLPPYRHIGLVKLRGKKEEKVKDVSIALFNKLKAHQNKNIDIVAVNARQPAKLRGNFYWQILIKSSDAKNISKFLKIYLKGYKHSGIIVTVDIDPV